ncbi:hypothetical protein [Paraburkholderia youngii]|uniref:hypothetical protein n=1 Tax=Paraburkholderia youngii TaxID=2782701 RepID=UPI003D193656
MGREKRARVPLQHFDKHPVFVDALVDPRLTEREEVSKTRKAPRTGNESQHQPGGRKSRWSLIGKTVAICRGNSKYFWLFSGMQKKVLSALQLTPEVPIVLG